MTISLNSMLDGTRTLNTASGRDGQSLTNIQLPVDQLAVVLSLRSFCDPILAQNQTGAKLYTALFATLI